MFAPGPLEECPLCGEALDIGGGPNIDVENGKATQALRCIECGSEFEEVYTFSGFEILIRNIGEEKILTAKENKSILHKDVENTSGGKTK